MSVHYVSILSLKPSSRVLANMFFFFGGGGHLLEEYVNRTRLMDYIVSEIKKLMDYVVSEMKRDKIW
jgi:hypothetical protein